MRKKTTWRIEAEYLGDSTPEKIWAMVERGNALKVTLCAEICAMCGLAIPCGCEKGNSNAAETKTIHSS